MTTNIVIRRRSSTFLDGLICRRRAHSLIEPPLQLAFASWKDLAAVVIDTAKTDVGCGTILSCQSCKRFGFSYLARNRQKPFRVDNYVPSVHREYAAGATAMPAM